MFITYYEALLTPSDYDELYYELLRNRRDLLKFYDMSNEITNQ